MSEKNMEELEAERLAADVKRIVAAMLGELGIETKAGAAVYTAEAEERRGEEVKKKHGI